VKTVLFAWELGAGSGHLMQIRRMAQRLRSYGIRSVAAVTRLDSIAVLDDVVTEIHRMPRWPGIRIDPRSEAPPPWATLNDRLVIAGLGDQGIVRTMIAAWDRLYRSLKPALVVTDYAPAASLAARHRIPLLQTGNGFTLPPDGMQEFPPLYDDREPVHREEQTLATVNAVLAHFGTRTLDRLPQIFAGDASLVYALPLLDPYASRRPVTADGPLLDDQSRPRAPDASTVFVYISQGIEVRDDLVRALLPVAERVRIHAPMLAEDARKELAHRGARIEQEPVEISSTLAGCRLVVHLGGSGLAAEAALAGVPQLALTLHIEQHLTAIALERAGIGQRFAAHDPAVELPGDTITKLIGNEEMAHRAASTATGLRSALPRVAAIDRFAGESARLLGQQA